MRRPFAKLMEMVEEAVAVEPKVTLGELSAMWEEDLGRIMDAIDANKVVRGEKGYIGF